MRSRIDQFWLSQLDRPLGPASGDEKGSAMAQETTGAGTPGSKDPGTSGSDTTGMTDQERDQVASKLSIVSRCGLELPGSSPSPLSTWLRLAEFNSRCCAVSRKFTAFRFPKIEANRS